MEIKRENLIAIYEQALVSKPSNPSVYSQLAKLYYAQGNFKAALDTYQMGLQLQPELKAPDETIKQLYLANSKNINDKENSELYKWITLDTESVNKGSGSIDLLYAGELSGILIKKVFSTSEIETAKKNIESLEIEYHNTSYGVNFGFSLTHIKDDLNEYFQKASDFRVQLSKIFTNLFEQRIFETFNNLCNLRNIKLLERTNNSICTPAQIRIVHPNKQGIKAHTDNEVFEKRQIYQHLKEIRKDIDILSYFIVIGKPEKGGELILYDLLREQTTSSMKQNFYSCQLDSFLDNFRKQYINPDIGDMVIFNGGRIWHKVADFDGDKNRITVGGFLAHSQDNHTVYCLV
jgi:tetratricopeptide (TPR) repeat protein